MKLSLLFKSVVAVGLVAALSSCVDPYYASQGPSYHETTTVYRPGYAVQTLPSGYRTETIGGSRYYYSNNTYYRSQGGRYVVVDSPRRGGPPPRRDNDRWDNDNRRGPDNRRDDDRRGGGGGYSGYGRTQENVTVIRQLPAGARVETYQGQRYYRSGSSYYQSRGNGYVIVNRP